MVEGKNNELILTNSKGKLMRTELPVLKLGEGIDKLISFLPKKTLTKLEDFYEELRKEGLNEQNIKDKYRGPLIVLAYVINMNLSSAKREDNKNLNAWINNSKYGFYRRENMRIALKKVFRFWKKTGSHNPKEVWDVIRPRNETKPKPQKPKKMVKENEEVDKIVNEAGNNRDKLYIAIDWNCGGRPIEIRTIKFKQIYESEGDLIVDLNTAKKSGDEDDRQIVLVYALPYYHRWKAEYKEIFGIAKDSDLDEMYIFRKFPNYDKDKLKKLIKHFMTIKSISNGKTNDQNKRRGKTRTILNN